MFISLLSIELPNWGGVSDKNHETIRQNGTSLENYIYLYIFLYSFRTNYTENFFRMTSLGYPNSPGIADSRTLVKPKKLARVEEIRKVPICHSKKCPVPRRRKE